jgi:hypothetical protein
MSTAAEERMPIAIEMLTGGQGAVRLNDMLGNAMIVC